MNVGFDNTSFDELGLCPEHTDVSVRSQGSDAQTGPLAHSTTADRSGCFAGVAQLVEHVLGKDEVTGSIPVSSFVDRIRELKGAPTPLHGAATDRSGDFLGRGGRRPEPRRSGAEAPIPVSSFVGNSLVSRERRTTFPR